jgi:hypothetical protein
MCFYYDNNLLVLLSLFQQENQQKTKKNCLCSYSLSLKNHHFHLEFYKHNYQWLFIIYIFLHFYSCKLFFCDVLLMVVKLNWFCRRHTRRQLQLPTDDHLVSNQWFETTQCHSNVAHWFGFVWWLAIDFFFWRAFFIVFDSNVVLRIGCTANAGCALANVAANSCPSSGASIICNNGNITSSKWTTTINRPHSIRKNLSRVGKRRVYLPDTVDDSKSNKIGLCGYNQSSSAR